jgi:hypothetical protein
MPAFTENVDSRINSLVGDNGEEGSASGMPKQSPVEIARRTWLVSLDLPGFQVLSENRQTLEEVKGDKDKELPVFEAREYVMDPARWSRYLNVATQSEILLDVSNYRVPGRSSEALSLCRHCDTPWNDHAKNCGQICIDSFGVQNFGPGKEAIELLRTMDGRGIGVFIRGSLNWTIPAGFPLGEYLGELVPAEEYSTAYTFEVPGFNRERHGFECSIDSSCVGNWTRFANSHCDPNCDARLRMVGKRVCVMFLTRRELVPGEEVTISYGSGYFRNRKLLCRCSTQPVPHWPPIESRVRQ